MSTAFEIGDQTSEMELDPTTMKVADLKRELKVRGLSVTGKKEELVERLQLAIMPVGDGSMNSGGADEDDDLLAQANALLEDEPITTTEKKMMNRNDGQTKKKVAIKRDTALPAVSDTKTSGTVTTDTQNVKTPEKVTANTKQLSSLTEKGKTRVLAPGSNGTSTIAIESKSATPGEPNKLEESKGNQVSDSDKAKSRAERFGITSTNIDEKKSARAARFGISSSSTKIGESPSVDLDTLKRRAERFGQSTSKTMQKLELEEKIKERESRFGKVETTSTEPKRARITAPNENLLTDEKMKKRGERFGIKA